jgi:GH25 family lysozyme M1 (1,4-beta-N-acetylmuramidase)
MTDATTTVACRRAAKRVRHCGVAVALLVGLIGSGPAAFGQSRVAGIDVSQFQVAMNWAIAYAKGVRFTFVRATRGPTTGTSSVNDTKTSTFVPGARAAGILAGVYHYGRPDLIAQTSGQPTDASVLSSAKDEAAHFHQTAGAYMTAGYLRPVLDLEAGGQDLPTGFVPLSKAKLSLWATTFSAEIQRLANTAPLIYMNSNYAINYVDASVTNHDLWLANYNETTYGAPLGSGSPPTGAWQTNGKTWSFWQYDADGNGLGSAYGAASADIDLDAARGDINFVRSFLVPEPAAAAVALGAGGVLAGRRRKARRLGESNPCP